MLWTLFSIAQLPPPSSPSLFSLFRQSGPMAMAVLAILVIFSVLSWTIMIAKWVQFRRADAQSRRFLEIFRNSKRFSEVNAATNMLAASPLVGMFQAGYIEVDAQVKAQHDSGAAQRYRIKSLQAVERSLRRALQVELSLISRGIPFLATTASACPFIGLFGTVWGIMVAFSDIGRSGSTSIVAVAPGIAEALINTAAGLVAAIPALIGYNLFSSRLRRLRLDMDDFGLEFLNLTERNFT